MVLAVLWVLGEQEVQACAQKGSHVLVHHHDTGGNAGPALGVTRFEVGVHNAARKHDGCQGWRVLLCPVMALLRQGDHAE